jgi:hypothetical protein
MRGERLSVVTSQWQQGERTGGDHGAMPWQRKMVRATVASAIQRFARKAWHAGLVTPEGRVFRQDAGGYRGRSQTAPGMQGSRRADGKLT